MALLLAACGGGTDSKTSAGSGDQLKGPNADQVASQFARVAGTSLEKIGAETPDWTLLHLPQGADRYEQYGVFSLYVVKTERGRKILLSPSGKPLPEGRQRLLEPVVVRQLLGHPAVRRQRDPHLAGG
jgi:hypothetical protein